MAPPDNTPTVTVVCTTYNQRDYVEEAIRSVMAQNYPRVELIVIDNASTDGTADRIRELCPKYPSIRFVANATNRGLCAAFNQGLRLASGKYLVDLSGDDALLSQRLARQVAFFEQLPADYGVIFSNARYIDTQSIPLHTHFPVDSAGRAVVKVPQGDVYRAVLERYFICTPTMMMRRSLLDALGGYDESLAYEDFDFWVRSAIRCRYGYQDEVLTCKRVLRHSLSHQAYVPGNRLLESSLRVCQKAKTLNRDRADDRALARRLRAYVRKCFYAGAFDLALRFHELLRTIERPGPLTDAVAVLCRMRLPVSGLYRRYLDWKTAGTLRKAVDCRRK